MTHNFAWLDEPIRQAGFFTTHQSLEYGETRCICASKRRSDGRGLTGNSFWVCSVGKDWFVGVWSGFVYKFPNKKFIVPFCIEFLRRHPDETMGIVDDDLRGEYELSLLSDAEQGQIFGNSSSDEAET